MKDFSIDIIKNNIYYLKSPFEGEIIRFFVEKSDLVKKGQTIAVVKTDGGYVELDAEFQGTVRRICVEIDEPVAKWEDILEIGIEFNLYDNFNYIEKNVHSPDYNIIYMFQQEIMPKLLYGDSGRFMKGFDMDNENFIYFLLKEIYENQHIEIPFSPNSFNVTESNVSGNIRFIRIDWKGLICPLLAQRIYILINLETFKIQYFTSENSLNDDIMLSTIVVDNGGLTRYNYGPAPQDLNLEAERVLEIFIHG